MTMTDAIVGTLAKQLTLCKEPRLERGMWGNLGRGTGGETIQSYFTPSDSDHIEPLLKQLMCR